MILCHCFASQKKEEISVCRFHNQCVTSLIFGRINLKHVITIHVSVLKIHTVESWLIRLNIAAAAAAAESGWVPPF